MSERASRCPEDKGSRHTALPPGGPGSGECWTRDREQLGLRNDYSFWYIEEAVPAQE